MSTKNKISIAIDKGNLANLPNVDFNGEIEVIDTPEKVSPAIQRLSQETIVGFDTETRPNFRKGQNHQVALIQISTLEKSYLFRICATGLMPEIISLIEDANIMKVGLSLKDDFHMLNKINQLEPQNFVELQQLVKEYSITDASLQKIYGIIFGQRISKGQRLSNWEATELSVAQQHYAAIDAWACLKIYQHLSKGLFKPENSPYIVKPELIENEE